MQFKASLLVINNNYNNNNNNNNNNNDDDNGLFNRSTSWLFSVKVHRKQSLKIR